MSQKKRDHQAELKRKALKKKKQKSVKSAEGIELLLSPISPAVFFSEYFEKKPLLLSRNDSHYYANLFRTDDIRDLFNVKQELVLKEDFNICRVEDGVRVDAEVNEDGFLTPEAAWNMHDSQGYTMQVFQPQQRCLALARFMSQLEDTFGSLFGANSYLTPPNSQGLAPHYDDVEVFILQVEGSKRWRLYHPTMVLPDEYSPDFTPEQVSGLTLHSEVELQQGDLLYFPRGWIHQAVTGDSASHHVTLSTYQKHHMRTLLKHAFDRALDAAFSKNEKLRQGLPPAIGSKFGSFAPQSADQEAFDAQVADLMTSVLDDLDVSGAVDALNIPFLLNRLPPAEGLVGEAGEERLCQEDEIRQQIMMEQMDESDLDMMEMPADDEEGGVIDLNGAEEAIADAEAVFSDFQEVDGEDDDEDDDDDEEDEDEDDEEELAELQGLLQNESSKVKMLPPSCLTWTIEEDDAGESHLSGYYSLSNFVTTHMNSTAAELQDFIPSHIGLPVAFADAVRFLAHNHATFVPVTSIPAASKEDREMLCLALLKAGLISFKKPGFSLD